MLWILRSLFVVVVAAVCISTTSAAIAAPSLPAAGRFDFNTNSSGPNSPTVNGGIPPGVVLTAELQHGCEHVADRPPVIVISASGAISGACNHTFTVTFGVDYVETITGSYSGQMNTSTGHITFQYQTSYRRAYETGTVENYEIAIQGSSANAGNFGGSGTATYSLSRSCQPIGPCSATSNHSYSGNIFFTYGLDAITDDDTKVDHVEVVQVVQDVNNTVPLVAARSTVARVFVTSPIGREDVNVTLKAHRNGTNLEAPTKLAGSAVNAIPVPIRSERSHSVNFLLPDTWTSGGAIEMEAEVTFVGGIPDSNLANNKKIQGANFEARHRRTFEYLPICVSGPPRVCPNVGYATHPDIIDRLYPVPDAGVFYRRSLGPAMEIDALPTTLDGGYAILARLKEQADVARLSDPASSPDHLVGWIAPNTAPLLGVAPVPGIASYNVLNPADIPDSFFTLAHETAHNLGRRHTNTTDACGAVSENTDWTSDSSQIGEVGWDFSTGFPVPANKYDILSYCSPPVSNIWISPFTYKKLFEANVETPVPSLTRAATNYLVVSGTALANGGGGTLDNTTTLSSEAVFPASSLTGSHCLRFDNTPARDHCFTLAFKGPDDEPLAQDYFTAVVPLSGAFTSLKLCKFPCGVNDTLATLTRSANAPYVFFQSPLHFGTIQGDETTIAWSGSDLDPGSTLTYSIYHSADGGQTFLPILLDSSELSITFDPNLLAGGPDGAFKIIVSDGLNTFQDIVGDLTIGTPAPWGDLLCDGNIDISDAVALRREAAGIENPASSSCTPIGKLTTVYGVDADTAWGDLKCDGIVGSSDALELMRVLAGYPPNPPGTCPAVGSDVYATS